ncbi:MAG: DUF169 domain-containing protein [Promethearchaeota archaeon]
MAEFTPSDIGSQLKIAGRLDSQPLCVYGADSPPVDSIPSVDMNRCIAKAIFSLATESDNSIIHIGRNKTKECCPGGQAWFGFQSFMTHLNSFLSTGSPSFRNGRSEFLIATPDLAEKRLQSIGKITPLGKYIIIQRSDHIDVVNSKLKLFLCFGNAEQIRNLCSLVYFGSQTAHEIYFPWGPSCASFISYPAGMIENCPNNAVILGPTDPTGNYWFPQDYLSMGIPFIIAKKMAEDLASSFIMKRPKVAYPIQRE